MMDNRNNVRASTRLVACLALTAAMGGALPATEWHTELADPSATGRFSSLRIDKAGNVHVSYVADDNAESLKYAFRDATTGRWFSMIIAKGASFSSMVLDSQGNPNITYVDAGTIPGCKLHYAKWDGTAWNIQTIPLNARIIGYYTSIALDATDKPSISFYEYDGPAGTDYHARLRNVSWTGQYWQLKTVDGDYMSGKFNSTAIDRRGFIHIAYANVNALTAGVRYALWDGVAWKLEIVDDREQNSGHLVGYSVNTALDSANNPHVTYMSYSIPSLKYAVRRNGRWYTEIVESLRGVAYPDRNSIVIDTDDTPYITYYDPGRGLKMAHLEGNLWRIEMIDGQGAGYTSSVQIDHRTLWVSYADEVNHSLKVARRELSETRSTRPANAPQVKPTEKW